MRFLVHASLWLIFGGLNCDSYRFGTHVPTRNPKPNIARGMMDLKGCKIYPQPRRSWEFTLANWFLRLFWAILFQPGNEIVFTGDNEERAS
ncbi:hypothetical protein B0J13DRAFT_570028 [Dactylonectria estremocensis]|uniref:Secreted protein n=1 Tax=Dactylonectria estremocensis TaxID=1079267 RepID=A0A9P9IFP8_9HYPO|nr:hypothetical protein B0J13DRAFT_570028 [Dactylonectria estremocensis]